MSLAFQGQSEGGAVSERLSLGRPPRFLAEGRGTATFLLVVVGAALVLTISVYYTGFRALGGDDFPKLSVAMSWANSPSFLPNRVWTPLEFYVTGMAYLLTRDVYCASLLINGLCSVGSCIVMYFLARYSFGETTARISTLLLLCFPWHVWTSIAGQGEALYGCLFLAALYFLLRWQRETAAKWLIVSASLVFLLTALRHQAWILVMLLVPFVVLTAIASPRHRSQMAWVAASVLLMVAFPAIYLAYNAIALGDALYPFRYTEPNWVPLSPMNAARLLVYFPMVAPLLCPFLLAGIWALRKVNWRQALLWRLFFGGYLVGIIAHLAIGGGASYYVEQRYVLPSLYVGIPLAATVIANIPGRKVMMTILCCLCLWEIGSCFRANHDYDSEVVVAKYVRQLWDFGLLRDDDNVFVDIPFDGKGAKGGVSAIGMLSGHPSNVLGQRQDFRVAIERAIGDPARSADKSLEDHVIRIVLCDSPTLINRLKHVWTYGGSVMGYKVFFDPKRVAGPWLSPQDGALRVEVRQRWSNGVELVGITPCEPEFPDSMSSALDVWRR